MQKLTIDWYELFKRCELDMQVLEKIELKENINDSRYVIQNERKTKSS